MNGKREGEASGLNAGTPGRREYAKAAPLRRGRGLGRGGFCNVPPDTFISRANQPTLKLWPRRQGKRRKGLNLPLGRKVGALDAT